MKLNDFKQLIILIFCCVFVFFCAEIVGSLAVSILVFLKIGRFFFDFAGTITSFLTKGCIAGLICGIGIWTKSKLKVKK
ncbi:hypothetical protein [Sodalis sp. dw_96]|uniref:hypothetical protein n=1 Tax=Sodalis sp. dw_96 TaxID=2719794 RepID=UPI001BD33622|nr:hypothetical protein [Sodalis sp. dw_96]